MTSWRWLQCSHPRNTHILPNTVTECHQILEWLHMSGGVVVLLQTLVITMHDRKAKQTLPRYLVKTQVYSYIFMFSSITIVVPCLRLSKPLHWKVAQVLKGRHKTQSLKVNLATVTLNLIRKITESKPPWKGRNCYHPWSANWKNQHIRVQVSARNARKKHKPWMFLHTSYSKQYVAEGQPRESALTI